MKDTHCQSCGAPVALNKSCCPYCDTPYQNVAAQITETERELLLMPVRIHQAEFMSGLIKEMNNPFSFIKPLPNGGNGGRMAGGCISVASALDGRPVLEVEE